MALFDKSDKDLEELKNKSKELTKSAGKVAGALGKYAAKKGAKVAINIIEQFDDNASSRFENENNLLEVNETSATNEPAEIVEGNTIQQMPSIEDTKQTTGVVEIIPNETAVSGKSYSHRIRRDRHNEYNSNSNTILVFLVLGVICLFALMMVSISGDSESTIEYEEITAEDIYLLEDGDYIEFKAIGYEHPIHLFSDKDDETPSFYLCILNNDGSNSDFGLRIEDFIGEPKDTCDKENYNRYVYATSEDEEKELVFTIRGRFEGIDTDQIDWSLEKEITLYDEDIVDVEKFSELSFIDDEESKESEDGYDEMAFRAAVVAVTNTTADDVFKDENGNELDYSKFHSYSDTSGCTSEVVKKGTWTSKGNNKWHVKDMELENKNGVLIDASMDITLDDDNYIISNLEGLEYKPGLESYGTDLSLLVIDEKSLEVPLSLIKKDRK